MAGFGDVREELADGSEAIGLFAFALESGGHHSEEIVHIAEKKVVFVAEVIVEGRAADAGTIEDVLNGYGVERFSAHEGDEGVTQSVAGVADARIEFLGAGQGGKFR